MVLILTNAVNLPIKLKKPSGSVKNWRSMAAEVAFTISAAAVGNFVRAAEPLAEWVSDCICYVREHQFTRNSATPQAEEAWTEHVAEAGANSLRTKSGCWFVGASIPGKARALLTSPDSAPVMRANRDEVATSDYEGFVLD